MSRDNNFNLMRMVAAVLVLVSHSVAVVSGDSELEPLKKLLGVSLGSISVDLFFASSGFLVCASYMNRVSLINFAKARALRIVPGLFVMLLLIVTGAGLFITTQTIASYFTDTQTWMYFFKNLFLFSGAEYSLNGVFDDNPYPGVVNASLWTLPLEVRAYLALALICWFCNRFLSPRFMRYLLVALCMIALAIDTLSQLYEFRIPHFHFVHLFGVFLFGTILFLYGLHVSKLLRPATYLSLALLLLIGCFGVFDIFHGWLVPVFTLGLAYLPATTFHFYNRFGDYSYGVYIYAFPIQQALVFFHPEISISNMIIVASGLSVTVAYFSWHLVEKRCLAFK